MAAKHLWGSPGAIDEPVQEDLEEGAYAEEEVSLVTLLSP